MGEERRARKPRLRPLAESVLRTQSDDRLVALAREGHEAAFEEIVRRYRPGLVAFAAAYAPSDRAEDVVQESLIRSWDALRDSKGEMKLKAWLYTIVRNRALNARRDTRTHQPLSDQIDGVRRPDEVVLTKEELVRVVAAMRALPEPQREALVRSALEGRTHEQIAAAAGTSPGAVGQLIYRARVAVRARRRAGHPAAARTRPRRARRDGRARGRGGGAAVAGGAAAAGGFAGDQGRGGRRSRRDRRRLGNRDRALGQLRSWLRERAGQGRYARTRRRRSSARRRLRGLLGSGVGLLRVRVIVGTRFGPRRRTRGGRWQQRARQRLFRPGQRRRRLGHQRARLGRLGLRYERLGLRSSGSGSGSSGSGSGSSGSGSDSSGSGSGSDSSGSGSGSGSGSSSGSGSGSGSAPAPARSGSGSGSSGSGSGSSGSGSGDAATTTVSSSGTGSGTTTTSTTPTTTTDLSGSGSSGSGSSGSLRPRVTADRVGGRPAGRLGARLLGGQPVGADADVDRERRIEVEGGDISRRAISAAASISALGPLEQELVVDLEDQLGARGPPRRARGGS